MNLLVKEDEIAQYFEENRESLMASPEIVANDPDMNIQIEVVENDGGLEIYANDGSYTIFDEFAFEPTEMGLVYQDAIKTVEEYIEDMLGSVEDISYREEELDDATMSYLVSVLGNDDAYDIPKDTINDIKEHFLEYLWRKHHINIYRPMCLEDDEGSFETDYPYPHMVFEKKAKASK